MEPLDSAPVESPCITLLTDFGLQDAYVGIMKGVIAGIAPTVRVIDLTHGVAAQAIAEGAFQLASAWSYFPRGTIHVAVVDPGVGSARAAVAVGLEGHRFVAPDNGLLGAVLRGQTPTWVVRLENPSFFRHPVSETFHGRDVFAPVAAHLSLGLDPSRLGPPHGELAPAPWPDPRPLAPGATSARTPGAAGALVGEIVLCDRFGNLLSNIVPLPGPRVPATVQIGGREVRVRRHYAAVEPGEALALVSSSGYVEVAVRDGSAADVLDLGPGAEIVWNPQGRSEV